MTQARVGDRVKVHYEILLNDGTVFDSSFEREPLEFVLGQESVIPGFENGIVGMNQGDTKEVLIAPEDGFGDHKEELIIDVEKSRIPSHISLEVGKILQISLEDGNTYSVFIVDIDDQTVKLDGNHPLAGRKFSLRIELIELL